MQFLVGEPHWDPSIWKEELWRQQGSADEKMKKSLDGAAGSSYRSLPSCFAYQSSLE